MTNIILCGGSGTRLWPISRSLMPKQFVKLFEGKSLFQLTTSRNNSLCKHQIIVSNTEQFFLAVDQLEELNNSKFNIKNTKFLLEPVGRNTAPAIALACLSVNPDEIVLVTPSDHLIKNTEAYLDAVKKAKLLAEKDNLVTFGIKPEYPETGFGYIEAEDLDVTSDSGTIDIDLDSETLTIAGGSGIDTSGSSTTITIAGGRQEEAGEEAGEKHELGILHPQGLEDRARGGLHAQLQVHADSGLIRQRSV